MLHVPGQGPGAINGHLQCLSGGWMGAEHVPELCCSVLGPTSGSMYVGEPSKLTQSGKDLSAADPGAKELHAA